MKERLSKSIKRLEKLDLIKKKENDIQKNLNAYEIKVFRQLKDKYDLSINKNDNISDNKNENELTEEAKITLTRIEKGEKFNL
tara:strand:- start:768 stop:1016 length:249 start_codon:yes stop_codon:yes gene_type:complete